MTKPKRLAHVRIADGHGVLDMLDGFLEDIEGGDHYIALIDPSDEIIYAVRQATDYMLVERPMCKGSISLGTGCRKCDRCYEQVRDGATRFVPTQQDKPRKMKPIPVSAGEHIAKEYGYDQVVILARRVGEDPEPHGEHITTYGIDPTHCDVAALMGNKLKDIAGWPEQADFKLARDLVNEMAHDFTMNDCVDERFDALRRILERKA